MWAEQTAAPPNTVCRRLRHVSFTMFEFWSAYFLSMKLFIHIGFFSFLCKYIYFWCEVNIWIVNACTECVVGMYSAPDRNVSECGNMGGSHFFIYIGSYIILFICLFVALLLIFFVGVAATTFYIFCTHLFIIFQLKANSSCSNTQKHVSNLQMSRLQSLS